MERPGQLERISRNRRPTGALLMLLLVQLATNAGCAERRGATAVAELRAADGASWPERLRVELAAADRDARYHPRWTSGRVALMPPRGPTAHVDRRGAAIELDTGASTRMRVSAIGRHGALRPVQDAQPEITETTTRREIGFGVSEWWRALPSGLEHGVTLDRPPAGRGPLVVDVEARGLIARTLTDTSVALLEADGSIAATYAHLFVFDADGTAVPARMRGDRGHIRIEVDDVGARYPLVVDPLVVTDEATLVSAGASIGASMGEAVALSGDGSRAIVAGPSGARIFRRDGTAWTEEHADLEPIDPASTEFANVVALSGDGSHAVIGAPGTSPGGRIRVLSRGGEAWTVQATFDGEAGERLGAAVSLSADGMRAIAGTPAAPSELGTPRGGARVFVRDGTDWSEEAFLQSADTHTEAGASVALSGDGSRAAIGAPGENTAFVFARRGSRWTVDGRLTDPESSDLDPTGFGGAIAISGNGGTVLVGAIRADGFRSAAGHARVYRRTGTEWIEEAVLEGSVFGGEHGRSVALSGNGNLAVVGAPEDETLTTGWGGAAWVYLRSSAGWTPFTRLRQPGATRDDRYDRYGRAVSVSSAGDRILVGAPRDDTGANNGGAAFVVTLAESAPVALGAGCSLDGQCESGFCVDDVCCDGACGGGALDDCQACSSAAGAAADGTCGTLSAAAAATVECRTAAGDCDVAESCEPASTACPADGNVADGTACGDRCTGEGTCAAGSCAGAVPLDCDDGDTCTADRCDPISGCDHTRVDACCDPVACDDGDPCTDDMCDPFARCVHIAIAGCTSPDAAGPDAARPLTDAGTSPPPPGSGDSGCAASGGATPNGLGWLCLGLLPLVLVAARRRRARAGIVVASTMMLIGGCPESSTPVVPPADGSVEVDADAPPVGACSIDLLFVVDDSNQMLDAQNRLGAAVAGILEGAVSGGARDLHVGVVSTDLGYGDWPTPTCGSPLGDDGILQSSEGTGAGCTASSAPFLSVDAGDDLDTAAAAVRCVARLGTEGCGLEQPLESMLKAVTPSTSPIRFLYDTVGHADAQNAGFVRDDSILAVVVVSNEDDCSSGDPDFLSLTTNAVYCPSPPIARYVDGLLALRDDPRRVAFGVVAGMPPDLVRDPVAADLTAVLSDSRMALTLRPGAPGWLPSCTDDVDGDGDDEVSAIPSRRLVETARSLSESGATVAVGSACDRDYAAPIAVLLETALQRGCAR